MIFSPTDIMHDGRTRAEHVRAGELRRDKLRRVWAGALPGWRARIERPGVVVSEIGVDDFGRVQMQLEVDGTAYWTRPADLDDPLALKRIVRAIGARRYLDDMKACAGAWEACGLAWLRWCDAYGRELSPKEPEWRWVDWGGFQQKEWDCNRFGGSVWGSRR